jgi:uncharacterized protein (TIGR02246 family)
MTPVEGTTPIALYTRLLEAWNRRDALAFAALFTADGHTVGFDGSQMSGRDEIASTLTGIFEHHQTASYVASVREVRQLGSAVVLIRAAVGMVPPGQRELNPAVNAIPERRPERGRWRAVDRAAAQHSSRIPPGSRGR